MKELSIEEKATRYDKAIEVIRKCETDKYGCLLGVKPTDIFPELKEGEDELTWLKRFIKEEIDCLRYDIRDYKDSAKLDNLQRALAWLEKQDSQILANSAKTCKDGQNPVVVIPKFRVGDVIRPKGSTTEYTIESISGGCYRGNLWRLPIGCDGDYELVEQNPTDKVESKFKTGDWIVYNRNDHSMEIIQIYDIRDGRYYFTDNVHFSWSVKECDEKCHLWGIEDAKDGDVLATLDHILIFEKLLPKDGGVSYCHYDFGCSRPQFNFNKDDNWYFGKEAKVYPATKEQRDLLFQKMKEAGYEWDADKKELKEIDNEKVNGEDYGIDSLWHAQRILEKTLGSVDGYQTDDGILEHKCAISAVKKLHEQKPDWSEEDEKMYNRICDLIHAAAYTSCDVDEDGKELGGYAKMTNWFKSIKERVGCEVNRTTTKEWSEEDDKTIDETIELIEEVEKQYQMPNGFTDLIIKLKSLRPQNTWKPSDEQMKLLREVQQALLGRDCHNRFVNFMYELERLMKE